MLVFGAYPSTLARCGLEGGLYIRAPTPRLMTLQGYDVNLSAYFPIGGSMYGWCWMVAVGSPEPTPLKLNLSFNFNRVSSHHLTKNLVGVPV
jgi:hypothetical protein